MTNKRLYILLAIGLLWISSGQMLYGENEGKNTNSLSIEACHVTLTALGRTATFQGTAVYKVKTGEKGQITAIDPVTIPGPFRALLHLDGFECCMRHWRLQPSSEYVVGFQAGTTGETLRRWLITISQKDDNTLEIVLPSISECKESGEK